MPDFFKKLLGVLIGSIFLAVGINLFLKPYELLDGGMIGIGLIVNYLWDVKVGFTIILCSLPIFLLAWFKDRVYFYNSFHGLLISAFMIDILAPILVKVSVEPLISAIVGGFLVGLGIGIMLRFQTSTGGTDLLAQIVADTCNMNVGVAIFIIDFFVVLIGGLLLSGESFLLSVIVIFTVGVTTTITTLQVKHY